MSASTGRDHVPWEWIGVALLSHTAWGGYPVLARFLQNQGHLPTLSLGALSNALALFVLLPFVIRRLDWKGLRLGTVLLFVAIVIVRSTANIYSARFTLATYVQIITLMTPFFVALLSRTLLGERLPRFTVPAVGLSILGAMLMATTDLGGGGISFALTPSDWIGIGLAIGGSVFLALYMIVIRRVVRTNVAPQTMVIVQTSSLALAMGTTSLVVGEDWTAWSRLDATGWQMFVAYSVGVLLLGTSLQNLALKHLSATFHTTLQAWRLVSTVGLAGLVLGEWLTSVWQVVGALIISVTITAYSYLQSARAAPKGK